MAQNLLGPVCPVPLTVRGNRLGATAADTAADTMKKLMYDGLHCVFRLIKNLETKPPKNLENHHPKASGWMVDGASSSSTFCSRSCLYEQPFLRTYRQKALFRCSLPKVEVKRANRSTVSRSIEVQRADRSAASRSWLK